MRWSLWRSVLKVLFVSFIKNNVFKVIKLNLIIKGITLPDLRYHVRLLMRGNPIEELETIQKVRYLIF